MPYTKNQPAHNNKPASIRNPVFSHYEDSTDNYSNVVYLCGTFGSLSESEQADFIDENHWTPNDEEQVLMVLSYKGELLELTTESDEDDFDFMY